jgi:Domain of unknown function (DUF4159)
MRQIPLRFRLRTLLILVALTAIALWPAMLWLRPTPKLVVQGITLSPLWHIPSKTSPGLKAWQNPREIPARDPNLIYYSIIHLHGQGPLSYSQDDLKALRRHLDPGGGTVFADGDYRNPAFDADFRRFVAVLLPNQLLIRIPTDDELYSTRVGNDPSGVQYNRAAGGGRGYPQLEGVMIDGRWGIIYSNYDISCAQEGNLPDGFPGYTREGASKIFDNITIHSILP